MSDDIAIETLINRIPPSWEAVPFRRLATLVDSTNKGGNATLLSLSSKGVLAPREEFDGLGRQAPSNDTVERYWLTEPGNLVVNPMWLVGGGIGVSGTAGAVSPDYRVYSLRPDLYPGYIHHLLRSQPYRDQYKLYTRADTTFDRRISKIDFHAMPVLVPPLDEQRRIADFLDAETARIDILVGQRIRQRDLVDELALSIIEDAIGRIREPSMVRLGYLALVQAGVTVDSSRQNDDDSVTLPYLRVANVQAGYVRLDDIAEITVSRRAAAASQLRPGDVLMTEGGDLDKLGRGTVWCGEIENCLHQNHVFAVRVDTNVLDPNYLALLTRSPAARRYFESTGNKTTNLASTSSSKIRDFRVPLIGIDVQRKVVNDVDVRLRSVSQFEETISRQLTLLAERRQALITAAVTGQIDVTVARGADTSGLSLAGGVSV